MVSSSDEPSVDPLVNQPPKASVEIVKETYDPPKASLESVKASDPPQSPAPSPPSPAPSIDIERKGIDSDNVVHG